jgi:hypothetical protein
MADARVDAGADRRRAARRDRAPEKRIDSAGEARKLARQREGRRLALRRVQVPEHGELRVAQAATPGERVPQAPRLADRDVSGARMSSA